MSRRGVERTVRRAPCSVYGQKPRHPNHASQQRVCARIASQVTASRVALSMGTQWPAPVPDETARVNLDLPAVAAPMTVDAQEDPL